MIRRSINTISISKGRRSSRSRVIEGQHVLGAFFIRRADKCLSLVYLPLILVSFYGATDMGGQAGIRGYLIQTLICVLDSVSDDSKWLEVTLEPSHLGDKVDILWSYGSSSKVVQVRSSQNQIGLADAQRWAKELEDSVAADQYELRLVGPSALAVTKLQRFGKVSIPAPQPLNISTLIAEASHKLDIYIRRSIGHVTTPDNREQIVERMLSRFSYLSTEGRSVKRCEFDDILKSMTIEGLTDTQFRIGSVVPNFTARENEVRQVVEALTHNDSQRVACAIRGMGGVGKTSIAIKAAHVLREEFYPSAVIVNFNGLTESPLNAIEAMAHINQQLIPGLQIKSNIESTFRALMSSTKAIIILDNVISESQIEPILHIETASAYIVTSRNTIACDGLVNVQVDLMNELDSLVMLRAICGEKGSNEELLQIAQLCGYLPLALRVAGDFLRLHSNWTCKRYTIMLKDLSTRLKWLSRKEGDNEVQAVLALSAFELCRNNADAAACWQCMSVFPGDFDEFAAAVICGLFKDNDIDEHAILSCLTTLYERSLLHFNDVTNRYTIHDLFKPIAEQVFKCGYIHELGNSSDARLRSARNRYFKLYTITMSDRQEVFKIADVISARISAKHADNPDVALPDFDKNASPKELITLVIDKMKQIDVNEKEELLKVNPDLSNLGKLTEMTLEKIHDGTMTESELVSIVSGVMAFADRLIDNVSKNHEILRHEKFNELKTIIDSSQYGNFQMGLAELCELMHDYETAIQHAAKAVDNYTVFAPEKVARVQGKITEWKKYIEE